MDPIDASAPFPDGFWWGTATAGHQIEGGNDASNWWAWEQLGLVEDGSTSGRACDYWGRWPEDHQLIEDLGHNAFRLGIEWSRIEPAPGAFDEEAIDIYSRILADLQARGIRVCLTLNHWVLPNWLAERGGWCARDALTRWERFLCRVVPVLAPFVDTWVTLNEPMVPVLAGYLAGLHPPGRRNPWDAAKVFRRLLAAHAVAYDLVHDLVPAAPDGGPTLVGYAAAYQWVEPFHGDGWRRPVEKVIGSVVSHVSYGAWDRAVLTGRVPLPFGRGERVPGLRGSVDFVGVNYYMRVSVRLHPAALLNVASAEFDCPEGIETTEMGWQIYPPGFRLALNHVWETFRKPIFVTENGCSDSGDEVRRRYLVTHLAQVRAAIADGCDIRGYLQWTLMDNFEWREGFAKKFGLVEVDHTDPDLVRRPRPSAELYRRIIEANAVTPEVVAEFAPGALDAWR